MIRDRWFFGRATRSFTLQWHLTNACPFHCRHCYDRRRAANRRSSESWPCWPTCRHFAASGGSSRG